MLNWLWSRRCHLCEATKDLRRCIYCDRLFCEAHREWFFDGFGYSPVCVWCKGREE